jgi:hypothetical protein
LVPEGFFFSTHNPKKVMKTKLRFSIDREKIAVFCQKHNIRRLAFFGSVLREDFSAGSDMDVLVEFAPGTTVGFFKLYVPSVTTSFTRLCHDIVYL